MAAGAAGEPNRLVAAYGLYYLDNRPFILGAAELPYFRVPSEQWRAGIARLRDAGCNAITSSIPWGWHEPSPGTVDFTGRTHPQRGLTAFLEAIQSAGLVCLARPGPFIAAGALGHGYPGWLAKAIPQALARRADGRPEVTRDRQVYALLHPDYLDRVRRWYGAVADALRPYLNAPVVAWQIDDETGLTLANTLGRLDFNPDTVARYRAFLAARYEDVDRLRREWRRPEVTRIEQTLPPRTLRSYAEVADWQAFLEALVGHYLDTLRGAVRDLGIGLPTAVNEAADFVSPQNPLVKASTADFYGFDSPGKATDGPYAADLPFAGSLHALRFQEFAADERPLSCWALGAGWQDPGARDWPADTVQRLGAAIAHGVKGYCLSTDKDSAGYLVGVLGGAASQQVDRRDAVARLQAFIAAHEEELTASIEVHDSIAWLGYQPYTRLTPEDFLPGGFRDPYCYAATRALAGFHALLLTCGYNPTPLNLQTVDEGSLAEYRAAVFPSRDYLDLESYGKLVVFTLRGGSLVTLPQPPTRQTDGTLFRSTFLWPHQPARIRRLDRVRLIAYHLGHRAAPLRGTTLEWPASGAEPAAVARRLIPRSGGASPTPASPKAALARVRGDYFLAEFPGAEEPVVRYGTGYRQTKRRGGAIVVPSQVLLRHRGVPVAYRAQVRDGTSTVVGSVLGGAYVTSRYFTLPSAERLALRHFAVSLFEGVVERQLVPDDTLEVEAVARLSPDGGCLLFVINRLGRQSGVLRFLQPKTLNLGDDYHAEVLYSAFGSQCVAMGDGLLFDLAPEDVLVVRVR